MIGVRITDPAETPSDPIEIAQPRFSTNHLEIVTLTTRLPMSTNPSVNATPRNRMNCHSVSTRLIDTSDAPRITEPTSINGRAPNRST